MTGSESSSGAGDGATRLRVPDRAGETQAAVGSPCINICRMDEASGWCLGCLRTIDEITCWSVLSDGDKREVLAELAQRRASRPLWPRPEIDLA